MAACLAGGICATFLNSYVNMRTGVYGNFVLFYCAAVLMTIGLYGVAVFLRPCWARSELEFIGSNSLTYVCLNQLAITLLEKLSALVPVGSSTILSVTVSVVVLVVAMAALHLCALLLNRHFKWALGKF